jgi:hypothetical protein
MVNDVGSMGPEHHHLGYTDPSLRSLRLGGARRVALCQWLVHSGLVPTDHECVVGRGGAWVVNVSRLEGFIGYECIATWGAHRS